MWRAALFLALTGCPPGDDDILALYDDDEDGWYTAAASAEGEPGPYDCDDADADVHPDAPELCNEVDDDCDGEVDEGDAGDALTWYADGDGDGYGDPGSTVPSCEHPPGYVSDATDCDDSDDGVNPATSWYADADGDGHGAGEAQATGCQNPEPDRLVSAADDCDDADADVHPGADELVADGLDQDCDGGDTCHADVDEDGFGATATARSADLDCDDPGEAAAGTDCDDADPAVRPEASEVVADGIDQDCDGGDDCYDDNDNDGYGSTRVNGSDDLDCDDAYESENADDCDDGEARSWPGATEICDFADNDCDGDVDEGLSTTLFYQDSDGDGYGVTSSPTTACALPPGYAAASNDCDDTRAGVNPGEVEETPSVPLACPVNECCDGLDNDCDGAADTADSGC